jgi:hypothetical protein
MSKSSDMYDLQDAYKKDFFQSNYEDTWPMARYLAPLLKQYFKLGTVLDLGCASGHYIKAFEDCNVKAYGIEGSVEAKETLVCGNPHRVQFLDLREKLYHPLQSIKYSIEGTFMVMSIEVAEHIEEEYVDNYIYNITLTEPEYIYMTAASVGQGGHFHVNCQPQEYWIDKLEEKGYKHNPEHKRHITTWLYNRCKCYFVDDHNKNKCTGQFIPNWFPDNLMVFDIK